MGPKIAVFQHVACESAGYFETIFREKNIPFEYIRLYETGEIPRRVDATHLIFLGGPMSVNDEQEFPWLSYEKDLIRRSAKTGQKVLGICLGAQLIASAYGASVYRFVKEIGWHPLIRVEGAGGAFAAFPDRFHVFQLHQETFTLPCRGRLLASGDHVRNQAFSCRNSLGLQFHLELTGEIIRDWSREFSAFQRSKLERDTHRYLAESNQLCRLVANEFIGK